MNIKRLIIISASVLVALFAVSCKEDDPESLPYLEGVPTFYLPAFGLPGETFTFKSAGCFPDREDEKTVVHYYWMASPVVTDRDTTDVFSFTLPDDLCRVTVTCSSFAEGYYGTTTSKEIVVISADRENGSIKGKPFDPQKDFVFTDPRDGREYWCTTIGGLDWFKENLAWLGTGHTLQDCEETAGLFGNYYTWEEAMTACPDGWRVSSRQDWVDAAKAATGQDFGLDDNMYDIAGHFMGNISFNGERMWDYWPGVRITDDLGLSLMPVGYAVIGDQATFKSMYNYSVLWTSDDNGDDAYYRYIYVERPDFMIGCTGKTSFGASVRCVRDHQ